MPSSKSYQFAVVLVPIREMRTLVKLDTHTTFVPNNELFYTFINLYKETFEQFCFSHGQYRNGDMGTLPTAKLK